MKNIKDYDLEDLKKELISIGETKGKLYNM